MNIIFISPQPYPYGMAASKRIRLFAEYLAKNNSVRAFVIGKNNGKNARYGVREGVSWKLFSFGRFEYFINYPKVHSLLKDHYVKGERNVIMLYDGIGLTNVLFAKIGRKLGYKVITDIVEDYSVHEENTGVLLTILYKVNTFFDKRVDKYTDGIIVISKTLYKKYIGLKIINTKITHITISAENVLFGTITEKKIAEQFNFIYSGSYGNKDGLYDLLNAFIKVKKKYSFANLILAGKMPSDIEKSIKNEKGIIQKGMVDNNEYYNFLSKGDVLMMTRVDSKYANSGFPFKLGEYLASGTVVIATKISDVEDYLEDNVNALLADPSNVNSIYSKMDYAIVNRHLLDDIGSNGRLVAEKYFNPNINGKILEEFIRKW